MTFYSLPLRYRFHTILFLVLSGFALFVGVPTAQAQEIAFTVTLAHPNTHLLAVKMRIPAALRGTTTDIALPVWTPGSYVLREYATNVQDFAVSEVSGKALSWHKINKNTWQIEGTPSGNKPSDLIVSYHVYANNPDIHYSEFDSNHAFLHGASYLMHVVGKVRNPATISISAPADWKIATGLPMVGSSATTFRAPDFDILYDSPIEVGTFRQLDFVALDKPHRIIVYGADVYDPDRLKKDVQKIVETEAALMNGLPYDNYTFFLHIRPDGNNGLEHLNSTAIELSPTDFSTEESYRYALGIITHEYFHLWNVKRIRPDALGPFDYSHENYTRLLWVAEGFTSYYGNAFLHRAGLEDSKSYLEELARTIATLERTPGRKAMSLEEASFDAWVKQYRPGENSINSQISYYTKGEVVGLLLDLTIRHRTDGTKSLDDVMRSLFTEFAQKNRNYTPQDFQKVCEQVTGGTLEPFFTKYVRGRDELDYDEPLATVGLRLQRQSVRADDKDDKKGTPVNETETYLGAAVQPKSGGLEVSRLIADTPAYAQDIALNDLILAIDNERVSDVDSFTERIQAKKPGDIIHLTRFRGDKLQTVEIKLGGRPKPEYHLLPVAHPSEAQKRLYKGWLGSDLPVEPAKP